MKQIKPNASLKALIQSNKIIADAWEQADYEIKMLINIWASVDAVEKEAAANEFIKMATKRRAAPTP